MKAKKKLIISMLAIIFVLLAVVATVAITFALTQQTIKTTLNIGYTVEDIDGTASATYTVGGVETPLRAIKNGVDLGNELVFTAADTEDAGNLEFPEDGLALSSSNDNVVIKYTYTNTGDKHFIASMDSETYIDSENMTIEYGIWDFTNEEVKYSEQKYALVVPSEKSLSYWIRISIDNKAKSASFTGDFSWLLSGCDKDELAYETMPSLEFEQATDDEGNAIAGSYSAAVAAGSTGTYIGEIIFPSKVGEDNVTSISASTMSATEKALVTSVYIPDSVTTIEDNAFDGFTNMETVTFEQNENVGSASAQSGTGLTKIGKKTFNNCIKLDNLIIPNTVTSCSYDAYTNCLSLKNITLHTMKYQICNAVQNLANKNGEMNLIIGNSVTSIGDSVFKGFTGLTSVSIPDSVTGIGNYAFEGCSGLTSIEISNSVISIGSYAFSGCTGLTSIEISSSVTVIGDGAFSGCAKLTNLEIPDSVTSIAYDAFWRCPGLTNIKVSQGNTTYHSKDNCLIETANKTLVLGCKTSVIPNDGSVTSIGDSAFFGCTGLINLEIPNSITSIGDMSFYGCTGLINLVIPASVTSIHEWAFWECTGLMSIEVEEGNINYHSAGNCLIATASKTLITGSNTSVIPTDGSVTSLRSEVFYGLEGLTSIIIPDSITRIASFAFYCCTGLTSIEISSSVTVIEESAFGGCTNLTNVTFKNIKGWKAGSTTITEDQLSDPANAATLLNSTYSGKTWKRG